jgi:hypothetical protein
MNMARITGFGVIALLGLSACGPLYKGNANLAALQGAYGSLMSGNDSGAVADENASAGPQATLTRALIEEQEVKLLRMSVISADATGLVLEAGVNGSKVTWLSPEGVSFIYDEGLLVGTRGLGDDLMGADVDGTKRSLNGGGNHIRKLDFLNGLSQIERRTYQCLAVQTGRETLTIVERSYATTVIDETCTSASHTFKNTYWRDANGVIWQSRQWISDGVGYSGYQRL